MTRLRREDPTNGWLLEELPAALAPYGEAVVVADAALDREALAWFPVLFPEGRRTPVTSDHVHPDIPGHEHWDGVVPFFPCARLDLERLPAELAEVLRRVGADELGPDEALYVYAFGRSQYQNRAAVYAALAELIRRATAALEARAP